jgi:hypothetical protein
MFRESEFSVVVSAGFPHLANAEDEEVRRDHDNQPLVLVEHRADTILLIDRQMIGQAAADDERAPSVLTVRRPTT